MSSPHRRYLIRTYAMAPLFPGDARYHPGRICAHLWFRLVCRESLTYAVVASSAKKGGTTDTHRFTQIIRGQPRIAWNANRHTGLMLVPGHPIKNSAVPLG